MKKNYLYLFIIFVFISSCTDDQINEIISEENMQKQEDYLFFDSETNFKDFILSIDSGSSIQSRSIQSLKSSRNFKSLATLKREIEKTKLRSAFDDNSDIEEEMSRDEFNIMNAENLLLDPVLFEVMDTTLRIGIAEKVYKITEYGTFCAPKGKMYLIENAIKKFDATIIDNYKLGEYVHLGDNVTFINSFGKDEESSQILDDLTEESTNVDTRSVSSFSNNLHNEYNVSTYNWKNNSLWKNLWDNIRGKDVSKEVNFSKSRRVQVNVYNVNYGFYASSGIKVKMQRKKKFWFVSYWVGTSADKMAIGFNKLYGEMSYTNPRSFSTIQPTNQSYWNTFTGSINNRISKFIYGTYYQFDLIKDWVDKIYLIMPKVEIKEKVVVNRDQLNGIYDYPANQMYNFLKSQIGKYIYNPIQTQIKPKDPKISYVFWGNSTNTFNKDKSYLMGVQEYGRRESKIIRFDVSFGIKINNGNVGGFVPSEFKIKEMDMFGAAYYGGTWKGIRFIKE